MPNPTQHGHCWSTSSNPTTSSSHTSLGAKNSTGSFTSSMTGLTAGTTYYVRAYATNSAGTAYGEQVSFVTVPPAPTTNAASSITTNSFTANWSASNGATSYKLDASRYSNFSSFISGYNNLSVTGTSKSVTGLSSGVTYYYRVRAVNASGTSSSSSSRSVKTYKTPTVSTQSVTSISTSTATGNGNVTSLGVPNPTQHGHCWSTSSNPTTSSSHTSLGAKSSTGSFTSSMTSLTAGTTYYVRAYATNSTGTVYGSQVSFTTYETPTVTSQAVSSISTTTATGNGNVTSLGVPNPTQHGHCWSTSSNPTTSSSHTSLGAKNSTGSFTSSMTGLSAGTTYYVRAYATNSAGTVYGSQVSFTTYETPTVTSQAVSSISTTTATGNGNVTDLGVPNPTQHGHCWSTSSNPTTSSSHTSLGAKNSTGSFTSSMTGLTAGTTYYVRAYATNSAGTAYGEQVSFVTIPPAPITNAATSITTNSFTANWSASNGATSYKLDVSRYSNFSSFISGYNNLSVTGTSKSVTGLSSGVTYYYRVRAVNVSGTSSSSSYKSVKTYKTPTVSTQSVTSISTSTATGNGNVTSLGVPNPTQHGHCWSTSSNPTTSSSHTSLGAKSSTGSFTSLITGLTAGTTYYVRAYATNSAGTAYGSQVSFTTYETPTVTSQAVSSISTTTATGNGNVTSLGVPNPTQHGHCWSTSSNPTTSSSHTSLGAKSSTGSFTSSMTSLTAGTTYYVRAYATNSAGTVYGSQVSFTTSNPTIAFTNTSSDGQETESSAEIGIILSTVSNKNISVDYTLSGSAMGGGIDYLLNNGTITIDAGNLTANITIASIIDDVIDENNETVIITLSNPVNASLGGNNNHTYTIIDNDSEPLVGFETVSSNGLESINSKNVKVILSTVSSKDISLDYSITGTASGNGVDYTLANGNLTIDGGETYSNIYIENILDDLLDEDDETIIITLSNPVNASLSSNSIHTYTIIDNDDVAIVTTQAVTDIAATSASAHASITYLGLPSISQHGICWSTSENPDIDDWHTSLGSASETESYSSDLSSLSPGTSYYVRAYATNAIATVYGNQVSFTTTSPGINLIANLTGFTTNEKIPSQAQTFTISASNLTNDLLINSLTGYEYSVNNIDFTSSLTLSPIDGIVNQSMIYIRLSGQNEGIFTGDIVCSSNNASNQSYAVSGNVSKYSGGNGSDETNAYILSTMADLIELSYSPEDWNSYFIQSDDIDFTSNELSIDWDADGFADGINTQGFSPIGNTSINFTGQYNGNNKTISNLYINREVSDYVALFGFASNANIHDLTISNLNYTGQSYVGGLAGMIDNETLISACKVIENSLINGKSFIGGILGKDNSSGDINSCHFSGTINADNPEALNNAGGFVGCKSGAGIISQSSATGTINANGRNQGGFVGWSSNGQIQTSYSEMTVVNTSTTQGRIGGFVGVLAYYDLAYGQISNCYASGDLIANLTTNDSNSYQGIGGFIGSYYSSLNNKIFNSYSRGAVNASNASSYVGGFCGEGFGQIEDEGAENCFWDIDNSGQTSSAEEGQGVSGKSNEEMTRYSTYYNATWDFIDESRNGSNDYWGINAEVNDGYPFLAWQGYDNILPPSGFLYISEVCDNRSGFAEETAFIELFNNTGSQINLEGYQIIVGTNPTGNLFIADSPQVSITLGNYIIEDQGFFTIGNGAVMGTGAHAGSFNHAWGNGNHFSTQNYTQGSSILAIATGKAYQLRDGIEKGSIDETPEIGESSRIVQESNDIWITDLQSSGTPGEFGSDQTLPVTLSSFTANYSQAGPILKWTTQTENNNLGWNVYRSEINNQNEAIKLNNIYIPGSGSTSEPTNYSYQDDYPTYIGGQYFYWIQSISLSNEIKYHGPVILVISEDDSTEETPEIPHKYGLLPNYPNPFNPSTTIEFAMKKEGNYKLTVYDIKGRKVKVIFSDYIQADKLYRLVWDGKDYQGKDAASGIYFYRLSGNGLVINRKMILVK